MGFSFASGLQRDIGKLRRSAKPGRAPPTRGSLAFVRFVANELDPSQPTPLESRPRATLSRHSVPDPIRPPDRAATTAAHPVTARKTACVAADKDLHQAEIRQDRKQDPSTMPPPTIRKFSAWK